MITPSGHDDGPQLSAALISGDLIAKGSYILQTPIQGAGDRLQFNALGITLTVAAAIPAFQIVGPGTGTRLRGFTALAAVSGATLGQCWGQQHADHADVSGYLSDLTLEDFAAYGFDGAFDCRFIMGGVTVRGYKVAGGGAGFYFRDCGEGKLLDGRIENMRSWAAIVEGPPATDTSDHSAEDFMVRDLTVNAGGGGGVLWRNQGFGSIRSSNISGCLAGPAVQIEGRVAQLSISGNDCLGGMNDGPTRQQHGIYMRHTAVDGSAPPSAFSHVTIIDNQIDGSCIGSIIAGNQLTYARNKHTANSNVDVLGISLTNSDVDKNHCDSTSFLNGSARNSIFEAGACRNNSYDGNWVRQPIAQATPSGSTFTNTRSIV